MNETGAAGSRIITDAAYLANNRAAAKLGHRNVREIKIYGLAANVHALLGDVAADFLEHAVGGGRAVAADDVDGRL